jgi:hypothetical protein
VTIRAGDQAAVVVLWRHVARNPMFPFFCFLFFGDEQEATALVHTKLQAEPKQSTKLQAEPKQLRLQRPG